MHLSVIVFNIAHLKKFSAISPTSYCYKIHLIQGGLLKLVLVCLIMKQYSAVSPSTVELVPL